MDESSLTPGARLTVVLPAAFVRADNVDGPDGPESRQVLVLAAAAGQRLAVFADGSQAAILPGDARPDLAAAAYDAVTLWAPTRCEECIKAPGPCEDCAGDPARARLYGLLADALEGRSAGPLWERASPAGRVSVRVVVTGPGREPLVSGRENAGPAEAAGFLRGWADEIERVASQGGSGE